jgi:hypothetical protein
MELEIKELGDNAGGPKSGHWKSVCALGHTVAPENTTREPADFVVKSLLFPRDFSFGGP